MNHLDGLISLSLLRASGADAGGEQTVPVSELAPVIAAADKTLYLCGTLTSLTISSLPANGLFEIVFQSGSTATQLRLPDNVLLPEGFTVEADTVYDLSIRVCTAGALCYALAAVQALPLPSA